MRKIKFRGKTACCQLATAEDVWVYGGVHSIFENDDTCYISVNNYFEKNKAEKLLVKKNTIGQYTGLHDKNRKEIYEGDIIQYEDITKGLVRYSEKYAQYVLVNTDSVKDEFEPLGDYNMKVFEIIGNEFDNSNLLED